MSTVLRLSDNTELTLFETPQQVTAFADGQSRTGISFKVVASSSVTAESVNTLVNNSQKTATWSIVTDDTVAGTYSDYTVLAAGVTLNSGNLLFTLCKKTDLEIAQETQANAIAYAQSALLATQMRI